MPLPAGRLDQRITLQTKSVTRAPNGEEVVTWTDVAVLWARVEPLRGKEWFAAAQVQSAVEYRVTLRWRSAVSRDQRVLWRGTALDIVSVIDVGAGQENLELMCMSGVRNGL